MGLSPAQTRAMIEEFKKEVRLVFSKSSSTHSVEELGIVLPRGDVEMQLHLEFIQLVIDELLEEGIIRRVVDQSDPPQYEGYQIPYEKV